MDLSTTGALRDMWHQVSGTATSDYRTVFNALRESRQQKIKSIDAVSEDVLKRLVDFIRKGATR